NRGIKLVMAADCLQDQSASTGLEDRQTAAAEGSLSRGCVPFAQLRWIWQIKSAVLAHPPIVMIKSRNDRLDQTPDPVVILRKPSPKHRMPTAEDRFRQAADNVHLAQQMRRGRL